MKFFIYKISLLFVYLMYASSAFTQPNLSDSVAIDSLKKVLLTEKEDTNKVNTLNELSYQLRSDKNTVTILKILKQNLALAKKMNFQKGQADCIFIISLLIS